MAKMEVPDNIQIASLQKKQQAQLDLMKPGKGTPWEDRGGQGSVGAFFKTLFGGMFSPATLVDQIRRPETSSDVTAFVIGCGLIGSLAALISSWLTFHQAQGQRGLEINNQVFWIGAGLTAAAMPVAFVLVLKLAVKFYMALVSGDLKHKAPPVLFFNAFGYVLGPTVLALIPVFGPPVAALYILILWAVVGRRRMYLKPSAALIATILTGIALSVICIGGFWILGWLFAEITGGGINAVVPAGS